MGKLPVNLLQWNMPRVIYVGKVWSLKFKGCKFYRGLKFGLLYWLCLLATQLVWIIGHDWKLRTWYLPTCAAAAAQRAAKSTSRFTINQPFYIYRVQQIEDDTGLNANDAWRIAHDRKSWRALRPVAGQASHWLTVLQVALLSQRGARYFVSVSN